jgi:site-specific DNA recombinase
MSTAFLYIRSAVVEQIPTGNTASLRNQQDRLIKFCLDNGIEILDTIFESNSTEITDRPAWNMMISRLKRNKSLRPDQLLVTRWDRFSRSADNANEMLSQLRNLRISPQAIDQELNLSIPANQMVLRMYLLIPETRDNSRSQKVKRGIHIAKQEGRWIAHVPIGYRCQISPDGKKNILPKEPEATFIRKSFDLIAENRQTVQAVYEQMVSSGMNCSISNFRRILRRPFYYGMIAIARFGQEEANLVKGIHVALIDELLFNKVQDVLDNRKQIRY